MRIDPYQLNATLERYQSRKAARERNLRLIREGRVLEVDKPERVEKFLVREGFSPVQRAELIAGGPMLLGVTPQDREGFEPSPLERILGSSDLMGVAFLEQGLRVAKTVGRVWVNVSGGKPLGYGTGFMVSPRLLLTNHHVLADRAIARASLIEFNYQRDYNGVLVQSATFNLDPDAFFIADRALDYALVAINQRNAQGQETRGFGWTRLIEQEGKAIAPQWVNIIQHPSGEPKQLVLRENQLVDIFDAFLHYKTDTAPGSSGSPVYNDRWEVVGLHHSGVWATNAAGQVLATDGSVWREDMGEDRIKWIANEGIRVSRLVAHFRKQTLTSEQRQLLEEVFTAIPPTENTTPERSTDRAPAERSGTTVTVAPDGSATWNIPLTVTVQVGGTAIAKPSVPVEIPASPAPSNTPLNAPVAQPATSGDDDILVAAKAEFQRRADVLGVRLGYVFRNGWITNDRAVVVTVRRKRALAELRENAIAPLPTNFRGLPVEVTNPSIADLVMATKGPAVAKEAFGMPPVAREEIKYFPPTGAPLSTLDKKRMRVIAHLSPDAGWAQLQAFLQGAENTLTVGMFDFGAPHIADAVDAVGRQGGFQKLLLVMQRGESIGSGTKADDLSDDAVVEQLSNSLGGKFENAWVKKGSVNGWISSSYHIKVAVRDSNAFWLSSGNWQSSNQPAHDPLADRPPQRKWLSQYNREWHAIVEHPDLATTFEAYLKHDFENNQGPAPDELALPDLLVPDVFFVPTPEERAAKFRYFQPFDDLREFTVTPILSPDNYHQEVLKLVNSAQDELLIQNQTFNAPKADHDKLRELLDAVRAKQESGVTVRVIFRVLFSSTAREVLSALQDFGFDMDDFRLQKGCHTKGIVVDRKKVLLGSQNWSNDGVSVNRDASLLFDDEPLAQYFAEAFGHDWTVLAKQDIGSEMMPIETASASDPTPAGMVRLTWKDYMEML